MISKEKIIGCVSELKSLTQSRLAKYHRNFRRYNCTPFATLQSMRVPSTIGYWQEDQGIETDTTSTPQLNVIKSCIDTLTSKIAQSKVRPFFNCINGSFKDIQVVKQAQQFFDVYFDTNNTNKIVSEAFRDACIFDTGVIYINDETKQITKALPWQVYIRPAEQTYGKYTRVYFEQIDYPTSIMPENLSKFCKGLEYVTYGIYYDTVNHVKAILINNKVVETKEYAGTKIPFVFLHYCSPIFGNSSQSIVDMLNSIQLEIDSLMTKIKDASQLNAAMTYFVPDGSTLKTSQLNNRVGNVITYKATPNMTQSPVTVSTPAFIDGQYITTVETLCQKAYEMVGISQLSSMSQKPKGLDSGVALDTMENIEGDRFETQLNQVIRAYVDIAKTCLEIFPQEEDILPEDTKRVSVKWADIVEEASKMSIQFSAADSLSKDPAQKLQQLQQLAMAGIIPQSRIAQFMELPDLQAGYSLSNNAVNAVLTVIDECIEKNNFNIPDFIPFTMLKEEIINTQLSLKAANSDGNEADIEKLNKLYAMAEQKETEWMMNSQGAAQQQATQGQVDQNGMPVQQNVLSQEANMTQAMPNATPNTNNNVDMDVETPSNTNGAWNGAYNAYQNN